MTTPRRIQRRRARGWRAEDHSTSEYGARYVGRGTHWGNPWVVVQTRTGWAVNWAGDGPARPDWTVKTSDRHAAHLMAVGLYREYAERSIGFDVRARAELRGRDLMCWCPESLPCHADVLLELANAPQPAA